jgi:hypothetical protein
VFLRRRKKRLKKRSFSEWEVYPAEGKLRYSLKKEVAEKQVAVHRKPLLRRKTHSFREKNSLSMR